MKASNIAAWGSGESVVARSGVRIRERGSYNGCSRGIMIVWMKRGGVSVEVA